MTKPVKIYVASAFFNDPIYQWTDELANRLEDEFGGQVELYVPQRNDEINDKENGGTDIEIYKVDIQEKLMKSDMLIALLDGDDAGVNGEILAASMLNEIVTSNLRFRNKKLPIPIIGITTDMRYGAEGDDHFYINKMVVGAVKYWGTFIQGKPHLREEYMNEIIEYTRSYMLEINSTEK